MKPPLAPGDHVLVRSAVPNRWPMTAVVVSVQFDGQRATVRYESGRLLEVAACRLTLHRRAS